MKFRSPNDPKTQRVDLKLELGDRLIESASMIEVWVAQQESRDKLDVVRLPGGHSQSK